jgi:subtilisin family serine protease
MVRRYGPGVGFVYRNAIKGFSAVIPNDRVAEVRGASSVDYVERDGTAHATAQVLPWGIDRVDADESSTQAGNGSGTISNVNVYIIDTGIDAGHADLNVRQNVNFAGGPSTDCNGHGTHVAGTVAAKDNKAAVVGVAPGAPLTGVKVLGDNARGCNRFGSNSVIIKGVDWVTANAQRPAVANMSLDNAASRALDEAVRNSAASGVFYSIAAGNVAESACNWSPARAGLAEIDTNGDGLVDYNDSNGIVTTAATNATNQEASFSNYGKCVDIWAPGVGIPSTQLGGGITTKAGTSMAAPHVSGGAALYLSAHAGSSPTAIERVLKASARTQSTLSKDPSDSRHAGVRGRILREHSESRSLWQPRPCILIAVVESTRWARQTDSGPGPPIWRRRPRGSRMVVASSFL